LIHILTVYLKNFKELKVLLKMKTSHLGEALTKLLLLN